MKKILFVAVVASLLIGSSACKKCFHCYNECVQCSLTVNSHVFAHSYCKDSFNTAQQYNAAISADTARGYYCGSIPATYNYDFCTNQAGEQPYPSYFNKGKRAKCDAK